MIIPDWPSTTKWLSEDEKALAVVRLVEDAGDEDEGEISQLQALKLAATDYRVWLCILGQLSVQAVASLTNFLPTLVRNFGYSTIHSLLLTAPVSTDLAYQSPLLMTIALHRGGYLCDLQYVAFRQALAPLSLPSWSRSDFARRHRHHHGYSQYRCSLLRIVLDAARSIWLLPGI